MDDQSITCFHCGNRLPVPAAFDGQSLTCPVCGRVTSIPSLARDPGPSHLVAAAPRQANTKSCPFCAEPIHIDAKKCKHCGELLDITLRAAEEARRAAERPLVFMNAAGVGAAVAVQPTPRRRFPHLLHLLLTLLTAGLWAIVWVVHYLVRNREYYE